MTWMQEIERMGHAYQEEDHLWGAGIRNMIAETMNSVAHGQEGRDNKRQMTARKYSEGLEALHHAVTMRERVTREAPVAAAPTEVQTIAETAA